MGYLWNLLKGVWRWLGDDRSTDQKIESNAKYINYEATNKMPGWFKLADRFFVGFFVVLIVSVNLFLYWKFGSTNGSSTILYLLLGLLNILFLPLLALAHIQRKKRFRDSLTGDIRETYDAAVKKRTKDFIKILAVSLVVSMTFVAVVIYLNHKNGSP